MGLNFICENLQINNRAEITNEEQDQILGGIFRFLNDINVNTVDALKGVRYSMQFINKQIKEQNLGEFIMGVFVGLLNMAITQSNVDICVNVIDILDELMK